MYVYIDQKIIHHELARLPLSAALRSNAVGLAVRVVKARPFRLEAALAALTIAVCEPALNLPFTLNAAMIERELAQLLLRNQFYDGTAFIVVSPTIHSAVTGAQLIMWIEPPPPDFAAKQAAGIFLQNTPMRRLSGDHWAKYPFIHSPLCLLAAQQARLMHADYGTLTDEHGNLLIASGAAGVAEIIAMIDGALYFADAEKNNLPPNVLRQTLLELAASAGIVVYQESLSAALLARATEIFLADAIYEILPIRRFNQRAFTDFSTAKQLHAALVEKISRAEF